MLFLISEYIMSNSPSSNSSPLSLPANGIVVGNLYSIPVELLCLWYIIMPRGYGTYYLTKESQPYTALALAKMVFTLSPRVHLTE